ncbi:putative methyltransferase PMT27 [Heracleum sosnowskyi]|uniref:Methyltransferase PMT27 n=1 Tax=Heracleum sosnowskyi TaxID=360622 RepID=A0AAD8M8F3_9APIA|nr:putative methyltransferase PMT27 [Heracleum sosnowskyi]
MPVGKGRLKRSSGSSWASTTTKVVFVALCVFGVYMVIPRKLSSSSTNTTTRTAVSKNKLRITNPKKDTSASSDEPGDFLKDAIKNARDDMVKDSSDQTVEVDNDILDMSSDNQDHLFDQDENLLTTDAADIQHIHTKDQMAEDNVIRLSDQGADVSNTNLKEDTLNENADKQDQVTEKSENHVTTAAAEVEHLDTKDQRTKENVKQADAAVEDTVEGLQGKVFEEEQQKLNEQETQLRKESSTTRNQRTHQEIATNTEVKQDSEMKNNQVENTNQTLFENHDNPKGTTVELSEEENEQRMEQHQRQEEEQINKNQQEEEGSQHDGKTTNLEGANTDSTDSNDRHSSSQETAEKHDQPHQTDENNMDNTQQNSSNYPDGESSGIPEESKDSAKTWSTQADQSDNHKDRKKGPSEYRDGSIFGFSWQLCNVTVGADYIPCLDNEKAIRKLHRKHFEHRERHCPEEAPTCLVPLPQGYKTPVKWPLSREKIWYHNVPHTKLAEVKGHQNWVKLTGEYLNFPGGGTQFIHGALHYIDFIQQAVPEIAWGKHTRTVLDVGCGVASFGGYLFDRGVLTISFAPKDEHEAQVQFALERGIPAISAVMGSQRLPFPSRVFDLIHCARCRVPWHIEGGALLLELNRMLRPGGYFVWSATPVYQNLEEDVQIWKEMSALTISMCWKLVTIKKDKLNMIGAAIYRKPESNECYEERKQTQPPMCGDDDDPNAAWYVPLQSCMHRVPTDVAQRGSQWPQAWPRRLQVSPYWLIQSQMGIYGKPAPDDFLADSEHWQSLVSKSYLSGLGISWSNVRNVMDMRAVYGGFAAALRELNVWVLNVVNIDSPDTLPIIYERGLFGIYHDWCESFSTYPRTYDLLHADHLFSRLKKRCRLAPVMAEVDRIVRPGGKFIVRDESSVVREVENLLKSLHWDVHLTFSKKKQGILSAQKSNWRPEIYAEAS